MASTATTSTTNITGLRASMPGVELADGITDGGNEDLPVKQGDAARPVVLAQRRQGCPCRGLAFAGHMVHLAARSVGGAGEHRQVLGNRPQRQGGEEGQPADDQDDAGQQADEQAAVGRKRAGGGVAAVVFAASEPAIASIGTIVAKRPISIAMPRVTL